MRHGVRRPLVALVALVVALAIGYGVRALNDGSGGGHPSGTPSSTGTAAPSPPPSGAGSTVP